MAGEAKTPSVKGENKIVGFFKGIRSEFKRITWPNKADTKKATLAVILFVITFIIITSLFDKGFSELFRLIFTSIQL